MDHIKEVNKRLASILERITDGFLFLDREWRYTYINRHGAEMIGKKVEDLVGSCIWDVFPRGKENKVYIEYHKAMETMEPRHFDEYYPEPLNMWLETHCYPSDEGLAVHFKDVTERKEIEDTVRRLNERFELAQRAAGLGVWDCNIRTGSCEWTHEMFNLFGLDPKKDAASFNSWKAVLHHEDREGASAEMDQALRDHSFLDSEFRIARPDGKIIWIHALGQGEYDDQNQPMRMIGICMDITRRKMAEQVIEKERVRLQLILDSLPVAVAVADETGSLQIVNKKTHEIWAGGLPPAETIDQYNKYIGFISGTDTQLKPEDWPISQALRQGMTILHKEIDIQRLNGTRGTVLASAMPMKDREGKIYGALVAYMDITEMKETELNLARSNVDLQQFAYLASHDLQEPLRMVISYLSLLERKFKGGLDPKAQEYIRLAVEGGERMRELIDDLLEYSRVETTAKEFAMVDMNAVLKKTIDNLKVSIEENNAEIVASELPTVFADETQMIQVMQNLVSNAIKFHGQERPRIYISSSKGARNYRFSVKDNGIGLNMEYADKIFQMFQQLHSRGKYPGSGVGLAIVKKIINHHGGRVWVESEEGKGATFFFTIPTSIRSDGKKNDAD